MLKALSSHRHTSRSRDVAVGSYGHATLSDVMRESSRDLGAELISAMRGRGNFSEEVKNLVTALGYEELVQPAITGARESAGHADEATVEYLKRHIKRFRDNLHDIRLKRLGVHEDMINRKNIIVLPSSAPGSLTQFQKDSAQLAAASHLLRELSTVRPPKVASEARKYYDNLESAASSQLRKFGVSIVRGRVVGNPPKAEAKPCEIRESGLRKGAFNKVVDVQEHAYDEFDKAMTQAEDVWDYIRVYHTSLDKSSGGSGDASALLKSIKLFNSITVFLYAFANDRCNRGWRFVKFSYELDKWAEKHPSQAPWFV